MLHHIKNQALGTLIVPLILLIVLLISVFGGIVSHTLSHQQQQLGQHLANTAAVTLPSTPDTQTLFLNHLVDSEYIRAAAVEHNGQLTAQAGSELITSNRHKQTLVFTASNGSNQLFLQLDHRNQQIMLQQIIIGGIICGFIALLFAGVFYNKLVRMLRRSLSQLRNHLNSIRRDDLTVTLPHSLSELDQVTDSFNAMIKHLRQHNEDSKANLKQSTEDLQETLDTIEEQNIELTLARKKAEESNHIKSEFLANTSHEIRTPLNGIVGFSNLMLKTEMSKQQAEYTQTIRDSAQSLLTIINDILDFSKLEAGELTVDYTPFNFQYTIEETLQIMAPGAYEKKLELIHLPDSNLPTDLMGDPLRIKQVLANIIGNAIKFTDQGNIVIHSQCVAREAQKVTLKISVTDNGIGLSNTDMQHLFKAFNQVDNSESRQHSGTGLGLAITKALIERMGGNIGVTSEPNTGSTFYFTLCLGINESASSYKLPHYLNSYDSIIYSTNHMACLQLQQYMQPWQLTYQTVNNLSRCVESVKNRNKNALGTVVIIDVDSSQTFDDIQQLTTVIKAIDKEKHCRVIACVTPAHERLLSRDLHQTQSMCLVKPIKANQLYNRVCEQLDIHAALPTGSTQASPRTASVNIPEILVVDDNPANLQLASELLQGLGASVTTAASGKAALEQLDQQPFDLIFMDVQMPEIDGLETTQEIRRKQKGKERTPIVALTAHAMNNNKSRLLLAGMDDCTSKPVSEAQLSYLTNRWCRTQWQPKAPLTNTSHLNHSRPLQQASDDHHNKLESVNTPTTKSQGTDHKNKNYKDTHIEELGTQQEQTQPVDKVVDLSASLALANHKPDLAYDMLTLLIESIPDYLTLLNNTQHNRNEHWQSIEEATHKLYGSSCYCGVATVRELSGRADKQLQQQQFEAAESTLQALINALHSLLAWEQEYDISVCFGIDTSSREPTSN